MNFLKKYSIDVLALKSVKCLKFFLVFYIACHFALTAARADDGYRLWMRYDSISDPARLNECRKTFSGLLVFGNSPTEKAIVSELSNGVGGLTGQTLTNVSSVDRDGLIVVGTPKNSPIIAGLPWIKELDALGDDGYSIRSTSIAGHAVTVIASTGELGALYGAFDLLRRIQTGQSVINLAVSEQRKLKLRLLDHWDNLNGGNPRKSIFTWNPLPLDMERLRDYARANASIEINGTVLNDVNGNSKYLDAEHLKRVAEIADILRPYGVRVYLTAKFSSPMEIGGLTTADPLNAEVIAFWKNKADEIYNLIPDFGGFLVKANSEGQPGPLTYHRTHVDGANMMAAALAPHGGIVMWRAFVYAPVVNGRANNRANDRAAQAYDQLHSFDGQFAPNVMLQVKNGPIDFQPREPFHPLFGAMPKTPLMGELEIRQEYTGEDKQLVYLGTMWKEFLESDTYANGLGSTVKKILEGKLSPQKLTGIAGAANISNVRNWCGHPFAQANWYVFGRLAWNPDLTPQEIANEWVRMTLTSDPDAVVKIVKIMMQSREAFVSYETPLGLTHLMALGHHYDPNPAIREAYHHANSEGLGYDRTDKGSGGVDCYQPVVRDMFANLKTCPENELLWFHHVPWDYQMASGKTMWDELCLHYQSGVDWVGQTQETWKTLAGKIDAEPYKLVSQKLAIQEHDAEHWRNVCLTYFQSVSKLPYPNGVKVTPEVVK
jgi:alpha-glucuronidase